MILPQNHFLNTLNGSSELHEIFALFLSYLSSFNKQLGNEKCDVRGIDLIPWQLLLTLSSSSTNKLHSPLSNSMYPSKDT